MKNKSNNTIASESNAAQQAAAQQIQSMTWDEILTQAGEPTSREEMLKDLQAARHAQVQKEVASRNK